MTTPQNSKKRRQRKRTRRALAGNTIPQAARKLGFGEGVVRRAADRGQIRFVEFAGLRRITDAEIERVRAMFGIGEAEHASDNVEGQEPQSAA